MERANKKTMPDPKNGPGALPPLDNSPQGSIASNPSPFLKDRLTPLPSTTSDKDRGSIDSKENDNEKKNEVEIIETQTKIQYLEARLKFLQSQHEQNLNFLQTQHHDTLSHLHEEVDDLKRQLKDLQFKYVMLQRNSSPNAETSEKEREDGAETTEKEKGSSSSQHSAPASPRTTGEVNQVEQSTNNNATKVEFLEEEVDALRKALAEAEQKLQVANEEQKREKSAPPSVFKKVPHPPSEPKPHPPKPNPRRSLAVRSLKPLATQPAVTAQASESATPWVKPPLPFNATIDPLLVKPPDVHEPRPPTMKECQIIMKHMQKVQDTMMHELHKVNKDLGDVLYAHKWSPDAYLLAKACVAADDDEKKEDGQPHRVAMNPPTLKIPDLAYVKMDAAMSLPALNQTVSNRATERRKRTQMLQKAKKRKELLKD